jgi:hypothetical protein
MTTALVDPGFPTLLVYAASLVLVVWAVTDVARRPSGLLSLGKKTAWIAGFLVGWLFLGIIGAAVALVYLMGPRKRMNAARDSPLGTQL